MMGRSSVFGPRSLFAKITRRNAAGGRTTFVRIKGISGFVKLGGVDESGERTDTMNE
jgi:hypothetical protein